MRVTITREVPQPPAIQYVDVRLNKAEAEKLFSLIGGLYGPVPHREGGKLLELRASIKDREEGNELRMFCGRLYLLLSDHMKK